MVHEEERNTARTKDKNVEKRWKSPFVFNLEVYNDFNFREF